MRPMYLILTKKTKNVNADASDERRRRFYGFLEKGKASCGQKTEIYSIKPAQFRTTTLPDAAKDCPSPLIYPGLLLSPTDSCISQALDPADVGAVLSMKLPGWHWSLAWSCSSEDLYE